MLTAGLESTNAALLAQWEATEAALARARDDVHAAMERQGGEIGSSLAALTEKRISELKVLCQNGCMKSFISLLLFPSESFLFVALSSVFLL